ncbi:MAG: 3-phosphoglycerate dehydrogenase family protein [Eubacteriales bacterium]|jgi:D-3-phosphoglycerate dehydrogenase|nr:3-phosphoglycerate dehydrogenase family protein [Eubacteriales bacterium]
MYNIKIYNNIAEEGLAGLGDCFKRTDTLKNADCMILRSTDLHEKVFPKSLLAIARAGAGVNNIPLERCARDGIVVFNTPGANANAVKELVLTGLLMAARNVPEAIEWVKDLKEDVVDAVEKYKGKFAGHEVMSRTIGVVGLGAVGVLVANAAEDLGMKVIGYDPYITVDSAHLLSNTIPVFKDMNAMLAQCDYITIHVPYMKETEGLLNKKHFSQAKDGLCVLNFARNGLVNEEDILELLKVGKIRKYITDFPTEKILHHKNVLCIPHLGACTAESELNCARMAAAELADYMLNGNITNAVNLPDCSLGNLRSVARISILNKNIAGMLGIITGILSDMKVNISDMINKSKGEMAYTLIDVDSPVNEEHLRTALAVEGIISVRILFPKPQEGCI